MKPTIPKRAMDILIVDDEQPIRNLVRRFLEAMGHRILLAENGNQALSVTAKESVEVVITDVRMPEMSGLELLAAVKNQNPEMDVILMSAYSDLESAIQAVRLNAYDYIQKPLNLDYLKHMIKRVSEKRPLERENVILEQGLRNHPKGNSFIGSSAQVQEILDLVEQVAQSDSTVLIQGESGTGKELVARLIHTKSPRGNKPFVPLNCAAIVPDLFESELFGHIKGSFSGALRDNLGLFRSAERGTIFLDEIAEIPSAVQAKLLRTLQERCVRPVGGLQEFPVGVRVIAATNRSIQDAIKKGDLRKDLFYRLNVVPIHIPPLRERREDIPVLVSHFMEKLVGKFPGREKNISDDAMGALLSYHYPGNVRELENAIERAFAIGKKRCIQHQDLPEEIRISRNSSPFDKDFPTLEEVEIRMIEEALKRTKGDRRKATHMLGIGRSTLYRKLARYRLT
jgi:DNA-binding NtrC family response regulator